MSVDVYCPHCDSHLQVSNRSRLERPIRCPRCRREFRANLPEPFDEDVIAVVDEEPVDLEFDSFEEEYVEEDAFTDEEVHAEPPKHLFYKIDSTRISFTEYWWGMPWNPLVLIAFLIRLLRIPFPSSADDPPVKSLVPFEVSFNEFPDEVKGEFRELIGELKQCGFRNPVCHAIHDGFHKTTLHWVSLCHESGRAFVRCQRRHWTANVPAKKYLFPTFVSAFDDGTYLTTTSAKADMLWPDVVDLQRNRKANAAALWEQHSDTLQQESTGKRLRPIYHRDELGEMLEEYHQLFREFHVARGVFGELSDSEQARAASAAPEGSSIGQGSKEFAYADVYEEIQKQLTKKQSWLNAGLLLGVSMALFLGLGAAVWSFEFALMLIPVLLFHEGGHYVAMKYRLATFEMQFD